MRNLNLFLALILGGLLAACQTKPQVIEGQPLTTESKDGSLQVIDFPMAETAQSGSDSDVHVVVVHEKLDTERYTYLRVTEKKEEFWVAILRRDVQVGDTYSYKGGLLKKNFQSQEYNKIFETLYLVSDLRKQSVHHNHGSAIDEALSSVKTGNIDPGSTEMTPAEGAIKIEELISNLSKYDGKVVRITGKCVKVNPMIMGRNWVHLQDGSANDYDLTVTTTEVISLGATVSLEGTIALNKDFGAGYRYDVIMEGAVIK